MLRISFLFICLVTGHLLFAQDYYLFAGTYTSGKSKGIYVYRFNGKTGEMQWVSNTDSCNNPSFLAIAPNGKHLYAVNEAGEQPGRVSAFAFNASDGSLQLLNSQLSGGEAPCFVTVDKTGQWVLTGNYVSGSLAALPVNKDGSLAPYTQMITHTGSSINKSRQERSHIHASFLTPGQHFVMAPDLGTDKLMIYAFNRHARQPLQPAVHPYFAVMPGSGPRHLDFHPGRPYLYLVEELSGTVTAFRYHKSKLTKLQTIATHPADFKGQPGSADIHVSPDGKFLYASNRGEENNIAIFAIDTATGMLSSRGYQSLPGRGPRNFTMDPDGNFLLVALQQTNNIVVYKRDKDTGTLGAVPQQLELPNPVCLKLLRINSSSAQ
jgi:6-phosphogluconolactonase